MMSRRQWAWIAGLSVGLGFLLVFAKLAHDHNAVNAQTSGRGVALLWGVAGIGVLTAGLGVVATVYETSDRKLLEVASSFRGRMVLLAVIGAAYAFLLVAALRAQPPRNWSCRLASTSVTRPDTVRCGRGTFAQMRTFTLVMKRRVPGTAEPAMRARAADRPRASVALDSTRCSFRGPDWPAFGESQLALTPACGDGAYEVNLRVCDTAEGPTTSRAELTAVAHLEVWEANEPERIACD